MSPRRQLRSAAPQAGQQAPHETSDRASGGAGNHARIGQMGAQTTGAVGPGMSVYGQAMETEAEAESASGEWEQVLAGNRVLRNGARSTAVESLQELLLQRGHRVLVDGKFGPGTERAVRAAQAELGLSVDGVVGGNTARGLSGRSSQPARGDRGGDARLEQGQTTGTDAASSLDEIRVSSGSFVRQGLRPRVFELALAAFETAWNAGDTERFVFTVIDYELPSSEKRMWVINLSTGALLFHEHVTHGNGSDRNHDGRADRMSNVSGSNASNVGLLRTAEIYHGSHGESMRLDGLEDGFNDNARERAIVMHSASYATDAFRARHGKMGRSQGCPALDPDVSGDIIQTIHGGTLIFGYYPDPQWLARSQYLDH